ncbi:MAG: chemotaxis protein CheW [Deltaproteobacteria bacterium]|nr:chemotaxis protein CheW [Deltaproteobacteria bacterium]
MAQGSAERQKVEEAATSYPEKQIGAAIVKSKAASIEHVGQAIRTQKRMQPSKQVVQSSIRVNTDRLDRLIDMMGELVIAHSMVAQDEIIINNGHHELLKKIVHTSKIVRELQHMGMSMRMIPLKSTFQKMTRLVRDLSRKVDKNINFVTEGEETEIDRNMVDIVKDPLVHMVRNSVDHGIEMPDVRKKTGKPEYGTVHLSAYHSAGSVVVEIKDDGKGLDREKLIAKAIERGVISDGNSLSDREVFNLIFEPGFSTAEVVSDVSGRGVGMDVVKRNIETLRGQVEIQSESGKGSVFKMRLPLTLAIIDGMVIRVGREIYVVPTSSIVRSLRPDPKDLSTVLNHGEMLSLLGNLIPLFRLDSLFDIKGAEQDPARAIVMVIEDNGTQAGVLIDELIGRQQVVIKTLGENMRDIPGISGGAIMPNGRVGLILDVGGLVKFATTRNEELRNLTSNQQQVMTLMSIELNEKHFKKVSQLVYRFSGINLKDGKESLVRARLMKRLRALRMGSFEEYLKYIESDRGGEELSCMIDAMTTNKTFFFREAEHFNYLREKILPELKGQRLRFWSAACSSGEEPFSLAILLMENVPQIKSRDVRILATDISTKMLNKARRAVYEEGTLRDVPRLFLQKYFIKVLNQHPLAYQVKDNVSSMVQLTLLNLMDSWPMKGPFNVIFCRNVMIYFDRPTQQKLINRFWELIEPGGYLFVGHSESLSAISHKFKYIRPATYRK